MEDDLAAPIEDVPRGGQRGPNGQARVDRGQGLEQLGADPGTGDIALLGRIERARGTVRIVTESLAAAWAAFGPTAPARPIDTRRSAPTTYERRPAEERR